jgi:glutamate-1-semialdehyde 2,1-aminomutase
MTAARSQGTLAAALDHAMQRYCDRHPRSAERQAHAAKDLPGGSTRSAIYYTPFPLTWVEGRGNRLIDLDGNECLDFLGEYSAGLYGHSNEIIRAAIAKAANAGLALGGPNIYEGPLAAAIRERFPSVDLIRFTNSGTEANLMALVTVRALNPSRTRIMVFDGGYHGGVFHFRHGCSALNVPFDWLIAEYNDIEGTRRLLNANASSLCGVIVEPMLGGGCIPGTRAFLGMLREECSANAVPLIFDEVMTSRLSPSGLQGLLGLRPDLTTFGKYLGGGASFGAFGGRREIMERFDPGHASAFQHAGTFNNNVISMAAGLAGLTQV